MHSPFNMLFGPKEEAGDLNEDQETKQNEKDVRPTSDAKNTIVSLTWCLGAY